MLFCVIDTNIFHEFKPITEISWLKELDATEVCLVVTSVVVKELDKHKGGNNSRLRKKAKKWTAFLEGLDVTTDNEIRQNVTLRFDLSEPKQSTFEENNLSADVADDRLLAKAIEFANLSEENNVAIVSDDSAVRLKARGHNLCVPKLSEDARSKYEPDPVMQELNRLRIENTRLQNTQPKLQLGFQDSKGKLVAYLHARNSFSLTLISEVELDGIIQSKRDALKYVREEQSIDRDRYSGFAILASFSKYVSRSQIDEYYRKLEEYLEHYRKHLLDKSLANVFPHRSIELSLVLKNEGSIPAQNVEIRLDVQGSTDVLLHVPEVSPYEPSPPARPDPRSPFEINHLLASDYSLLGLGLNRDEIDFGPPWEEWTCETDDSGLNWYEYGIKKLQHHRSHKLEELYLMFDECDEFPATINVKYEVTADNMVDMLTGNFKVIVNKSAP